MQRSNSIWICLLAAVASIYCQCASATPKAVEKLAESYAATHRGVDIPPNGQTLADEYAQWFFSGFIHPAGGIYTKLEIARTAYTEGQTYWRDHPGGRDEIFLGYGYVRTEREGVVSLGFERASFTPKDGGAERWWFTSLGEGKWSALRPGQPAPVDKALIRLVGYLSPKGRYGHGGTYDREILITSFTFVDRS